MLLVQCWEDNTGVFIIVLTGSPHYWGSGILGKSPTDCNCPCLCVFQEKSPELTISYIIYLKEQVEQQSSLVSMDELKSSIVLLTNKGFCRPTEVAIHFGLEYGNAIDLKTRLPGQLIRIQDFFLHSLQVMIPRL